MAIVTDPCPRYARGVHRGWEGSILGLVALAACFAEPALPGGSGSTGEPPCTAGSLGCACGAADACDDSLSCEPSVSLCIDPMCTPGELLCTCADGSCLGDLSCQAGLCRPPPAGDTTNGGAMTSSPGGSATLSDDDGATTLPSGSTGAVTADTGVATSASTDPTGASSECAAMECPQCFVCMTGPRAPCEPANKECGESEGCTGIRNCAANCGADLDCVQNDCCANLLWSDGIEAFNTLLECVGQECSCFAGYSCSGGG